MNIEDQKCQKKGVRVPTIHCKIQTDSSFLKQIKEIAQKKKAMKHEFMDQKKKETFGFTMDSIHQIATKHAKACIPNQNTILKHQKIRYNINLCECGCRNEQGSQIPLMVDQQKISFLGSGVILLFFFLRQIRHLLFLCFFFYASFCITSNFIFSLSQTPKNCLNIQTKNIIYLSYCQIVEKLSFISVRRVGSINLIQSIVGLLMMFIWMMGVKVIEILGLIKNKHIDDSFDSDSNYHVMLNNLPYNKVDQVEILKYIKFIWQRNGGRISNNDANHEKGPVLNIKSIQLMYNMKECRNLMENLRALAVNLANCFRKNQFGITNVIESEMLEQYKLKKSEFNETLQQLTQLRNNFLIDAKFRRNLSTTCAILEFETREQQKQFLRIIGTQANPIQFALLPNLHPSFKNQNIIIEEAPQPSDILWRNCQNQYSYCKIIIFWVLTLVILKAGLTVVLYIQTLHLLKKLDHTIVTMFLQLLNRMIWFYISIVISLESNNTKSELIISSVKKSIIIQTINIIVNPIISKYKNNKEMYGFNGLAGMALTYQFVIFGMMLFFYVFSPTYHLKKAFLAFSPTRKIIYWYFCGINHQVDTIEEIRPILNFYEGPEFPVACSYVYITTSINHAMFYAHLHPVILLVASINVSLFLIIMKYLLLRCCKMAQLTRVHIFEYSLFLLSLAPIYFIAGNFFFYFSDNNEKSSIITIIPLLFAFLFWLLCVLNMGNWFSKLMKRFVSNLIQQKDLVHSNKIDNNSISKTQQFVHFGNSWAGSEIIGDDWSRKESYYINSPVNQLLDFELILRGMKDKHVEIKGKKLKEFCEHFCLEFNKKDQSLLKIEYLNKSFLGTVKETDDNLDSPNLICFIPVHKMTNKDIIKADHKNAKPSDNLDKTFMHEKKKQNIILQKKKRIYNQFTDIFDDQKSESCSEKSSPTILLQKKKGNVAKKKVEFYKQFK